jgi:radical SAM-linked protein
LGYCGAAEILDVILTEPMSQEEFTTRVGPALPEGLTIGEVREVPLKSRSLQSALHQAEYRVIVETSLSADELTRRLEKLLATDRLDQQRVRKGRSETFDLRPLVDKVQLESIEEGQAIFWMRLSAGQRGNARPDAVLTALDLANAYSQVERIRLLFEFDIR